VQEATLRATLGGVIQSLRCHHGRCVVSRLTTSSLREPRQFCDGCGFEMPSLASLERRLSRTVAALETSQLTGAMAVVMLDIALTKALRSLDCRLKRCGGAR
jgi:hypothetical protein